MEDAFIDPDDDPKTSFSCGIAVAGDGGGCLKRSFCNAHPYRSDLVLLAR